MEDGGFKTVVSGVLTLAQPDNTKALTTLKRHKPSLKSLSPSRLGNKGHNFTCIMLNLN
jgi:hypothetical protein